jgi:hypothetical protein
MADYRPQYIKVKIPIKGIAAIIPHYVILRRWVVGFQAQTKCLLHYSVGLRFAFLKD